MSAGPDAPHYASSAPSIPWVASSSGATGVIDGTGAGSGDGSGRYVYTSGSTGPAAVTRVADGAGMLRL